MSELKNIDNTTTYSKEQGRERSKREDSQFCCEILNRLKFIFKDDRRSSYMAW